MQANGRGDLINKTEFAVPVFRAYGHELGCQVSYIMHDLIPTHSFLSEQV